MAKRSKQAKPVEAEVSDTENTAENTTMFFSTTTTQRSTTMAGLSPDEIAALLGKTRTKGDYIVKLNQFLASGEGGICANENWVELKDKKASTLKQGFENAKDSKDAAEGSEQVKVIVNEEKVFLINLGSVDADALAAAGTASE